MVVAVSPVAALVLVQVLASEVSKIVDDFFRTTNIEVDKRKANESNEIIFVVCRYVSIRTIAKNNAA